MGIRWKDGGYSAEVGLQLKVGEQIMQISKIGPNAFVLRDPCEIPAGTMATIMVTVDGRTQTYDALLQNGVWHGMEEVAYI